MRLHKFHQKPSIIIDKAFGKNGVKHRKHQCKLTPPSKLRLCDGWVINRPKTAKRPETGSQTSDFDEIWCSKKNTMVRKPFLRSRGSENYDFDKTLIFWADFDGTFIFQDRF